MDAPDPARPQSHLPPLAEPLARGATIGRYMVLGLVGRGGMGDVYVAHDPKLARKVAVKLVRAQSSGATDVGSRMRLLREAQAIAKLSHPNVVVVHDVGTYRDNVFIAMEFVEGQTAGGWLHAAPRTWREVLAIYTAAGRGLAAAHQVGLIHRDFKPDNVMVGRDGQVRVMDFGLARQMLDTVDAPPVGRPAAAAAQTLDAAIARVSVDATRKIAPPFAAPTVVPTGQVLPDELTQTGTIVGTPAYMAPEQFVRQPTDARTDQFSFCVALYESLYGCRPFEGDTIITLTTNVLSGNITAAPPDVKIPAYVRRVLLRGLAADPTARWPSMTALLDALAHDPVRFRWRRLAAASATLAVVLLAASAAQGWRASHAHPQMCGAGADRLAGVWEPDGADSPRKARVRRAFLATSKGYAKGALANVEQILDRYASGWKAMYESACQATYVRGDQSAQALDLQMSCLQDRLGALRALVDVLSSADPTVVENAPAAAGALPALDRCADTGLLGAVPAPPAAPNARARVQSLRRDLAHVEAVSSSGQCAAGVAAGRKLVADARALGYLPLEADALNALARSASDCLDPAEAVQLYKEALRAAVASHHDEAAAAAAVLMAQILSERLHAVREARDWLELGRAILQPIGGSHPALEAWALAADGLVDGREGNHRKALEQFQRALDLQEKTRGADQLEVAAALANVGGALADIGRVAESVTYFDRARRLTVTLLGPDHPQVAVYLLDRGEALNKLGLYREALDDTSRAIAIWRASGASGFYVADGETGLAESLLGLGRTREAATHLQEALRLHEANHTPFYPATRFALARALWPTADQHVRAVALAEQARSEYERTGADATHIGEVDSWLHGHQPR